MAEKEFNLNGDIKELCTDFNSGIRIVGANVRMLMEHSALSDKSSQHNEMKANIMLAARHLEDARMRLDEVIKIYDGVCLWFG